MLVMKIFANILSVIIILMVYDVFFTTIGKRRDIHWGFRLLLCLIYIIVNVVSVMLIKTQAVFIVISIIQIYLYSIPMYKIGCFKHIISCFFIYVFLIVTEAGTCIVISIVLNITIEAIQDNIIAYLIGVVISKLLVYITVKLLKYYIKPKSGKVSIILLIPFIVMPATSIFILYSLSKQILISTGETDKIIIFFSAASLIVSNLLVFLVFDTVLKQKEKQMFIEKKLLLYDLERKYQSSNVANQILVNKTMHDFKNQLYAIKGLLEIDHDRGMSKIDEICEIVESANNVVYSGITTVDALVRSKVNKAKVSGILVSTNTANISGVKIDPIDLCLILGNILDNSIEACDKINNDVKTIDLNIARQGKYISITVKNSINKMEYNNKRFKTTKTDKTLHGFGLKNVNEIAVKYNGIVNYGIKNDNFTVNIILNLE